MLLDNALIHPHHHTLMDKISLNQNYIGTLSPLQVEALKTGMASGSDNKFANEVWSIGITVLSYAASQKSSYFYDWIDISINCNAIGQELQRLKGQQYSNKLITVISNMIELEESSRSTIEQLSRLFQADPYKSLRISEQKQDYQAADSLQTKQIESPPESPKPMERLFSSNLNNESFVVPKDPSTFNSSIKDSHEAQSFQKINLFQKRPSIKQHQNIFNDSVHKDKHPPQIEYTRPANVLMMRPFKSVQNYNTLQNKQDPPEAIRNSQLSLASNQINQTPRSTNRSQTGTPSISRERLSNSPLNTVFPLHLPLKDGDRLPETTVPMAVPKLIVEQPKNLKQNNFTATGFDMFQFK